MRYGQIRAFHYVATCKGFSNAARALAVSQPAVSDQVRQLEAEHDTLLFDRSRKQIALTAAGERLLIQTRRFFEIEAQIAEVLSESRAAPDGTLRIIADSPVHLAGHIEAFRARSPSVRLSLRTGNSTEILQALRRYEAEIGVVGSLDTGPDFLAETLGTAPIVAFASRKTYAGLPERMPLAELLALPLVLREEGSRTRALIEAEARDRRHTLTHAVEAEGRDAVREIVAAGAGVGFVSLAEFGCDTRLRRIEIEDAALEMTEALVCLRQRSDLRSIRAFRDVAAGQSPGPESDV